MSDDDERDGLRKVPYLRLDGTSVISGGYVRHVQGRDGRVVIARALRLPAGEPVGPLAHKGSNPFPGAILLVNFI